ncbi:anti-sigma factor family protein [Sphingosinicella humi]|uniref:Anti-sigma factor n=1 Tax=Allosphingosinicella humi TaxID=2068657 RepID=A0A2U2J0C2_9SPHN|nr:anti-sigma factor [Sphingosinicella humi]PWG01782.1 anti-sigma factor [Sphingosinicella humi]
MMTDDEKLMAYVDGELIPAEREAMERALAKDPTLREKLAEQERLKATLAAHYGPVAAEEVPERLLAMLGAETGRADVASLSAAREKRRRPSWRQLGTIAASLAVGLLAGQMVSLQRGDPLAVNDGVLVAEGGLAEALDSQLASAQAPGAATRIGVSFADRQGRFCRSFDAPAFAGLACREGQDWRVIMTAPAQGGGEAQYRQAGSSVILQAAQEMMAGAPLDAEAERAAVAARWENPAADRD